MAASRNEGRPRVRLAVVGAGFIGRKHLETIAGVGDAELAAIVDPFPGAREIAAGHGVDCYAEIGEMLDRVGPDGVIVCTPTELHLDPTLAALDAGAHVLVEKPIAATAAEARQIVAKAAETGRQVLVGHHRRYYPLLARAREIVEGGGLGRLITVHGHWTLKKDDAYYASDWRKRRAAGPVLTNLIHEIDTLRFICGEIRSISAEVTNAVRSFEKEDAAALAMTFESGAIGTFMLSDGTPSPWAWELATGENPAFAASRCNTHRLTGTAAALDFPGLVLWTPTSQSEGWRKPIQSRPVEYAAADAYERQCAHFCAVIRGDEAPVITAEDGARTLAATLAVFDAAESGRRVML